MENFNNADKGISSPSSSSEIQDHKYHQSSVGSPSAQEIRENRNTIIKILDTLQTMSEIRSKNDLQEQASSSCSHCSCMKRSIVDADTKYLHELMNSDGLTTSMTTCVEAYQEQDLLKFAKILYKGLTMADGVDKKRQKLETVKDGSDTMISALKREAILKAVRWKQDNKLSQYSFDNDRSELCVLETATTTTRKEVEVEKIKVSTVDGNILKYLSHVEK